MGSLCGDRVHKAATALPTALVSPKEIKVERAGRNKDWRQRCRPVALFTVRYRVQYTSERVAASCEKAHKTLSLGFDLFNGLPVRREAAGGEATLLQRPA